MTVAVKGSKIYTFGGKLNDRNASDLIQLYDVATGESNIIGRLPATCTGGVGKSVVVDVFKDRIKLICCKVTTFTTYYQHFVIFDDRTKVFKLLATCTGGVGKSVNYGNDIYIIYRDGNVVQFVERESTEVVATLTQKFEHFGAIIKDNKVLIIGCVCIHLYPADQMSMVE
jgi:hypothetical protein